MNHKVCILLSLLCATSAPAALIADWNFAGIPAVTLAQENQAAPNPLIVSSQAGVIPGLTSSDLVPSGAGLQLSSANGPTTGTALPDELNLKNWDVAPNNSNNNYFVFTLTADSPGTLSFDSVSIALWRNGAGAPNSLAWEAVVDGGAPIAVGTTQTESLSGLGQPFRTYTFSQAITGATSIELRFRPFGNGVAGTGNVHINDIQVQGAVVPEPSTALLGLSALTLLIRRRR
jgi:hypothetical protein